MGHTQKDMKVRWRLTERKGSAREGSSWWGRGIEIETTKIHYVYIWNGLTKICKDSVWIHFTLSSLSIIKNVRRPMRPTVGMMQGWVWAGQGWWAEGFSCFKPASFPVGMLQACVVWRGWPGWQHSQSRVGVGRADVYVLSCLWAKPHCEHSNTALGYALYSCLGRFSPFRDSLYLIHLSLSGVWRTGLLWASLSDSSVVITLLSQFPLLHLLCSCQNVVTVVILPSVLVLVGLCILNLFVILEVWEQAVETSECSCSTTSNSDTGHS